MPAKSKKQRRLMAIAEHHPEKLYIRNKDVLKMSKEQLSHYSTTDEKNLSELARKKKHHSADNGSFLDNLMNRFNIQ
jgi:hypothetical protein